MATNIEIFTYAGGLGTDAYILEAQAATASNDIAGGATSLRGLEVDMSGNTGEDVTVRCYDSAAPNVGVDEATLVIRAKKGTGYSANCFMFSPAYAFAVGLSIAVVQEKGGTAGVTAPSGTVNVKVL